MRVWESSEDTTAAEAGRDVAEQPGWARIAGRGVHLGAVRSSAVRMASNPVAPSPLATLPRWAVAPQHSLCRPLRVRVRPPTIAGRLAMAGRAHTGSTGEHDQTGDWTAS